MYVNLQLIFKCGSVQFQLHSVTQFKRGVIFMPTLEKALIFYTIFLDVCLWQIPNKNSVWCKNTGTYSDKKQLVCGKTITIHCSFFKFWALLAPQQVLSL